MTIDVRQVFPAPRTLTRTDFADLEEINRAAHLTFGDERVIDFFAAVSRLLLRPHIARSNPELAALGFFLRRSQLFRRLTAMGQEPDRLRVPRGLVCQFPPANIPVIFGYSWALSALAGNVNVVRLSGRDSPSAEILIDALGEALNDAAPVIGLTQRLLRYGRDDTVTALLSSLCDLRVMWGADDIVTEIRRHPLAPSARDLPFPDRVSFAVMSAAGWLLASRGRREQVVEHFYNDSYQYDQAACASPQTVYWVGEPDIVAHARQGFMKELAALVSARGEMSRSWPGPGAFAFGSVPVLQALVPVIDRCHQTVTHFGFSDCEITRFAAALRGRGIDRLVPVGEALAFDTVWDGYDLLLEFSRVMTVR